MTVPSFPCVTVKTPCEPSALTVQPPLEMETVSVDVVGGAEAFKPSLSRSTRNATTFPLALHHFHIGSKPAIEVPDPRQHVFFASLRSPTNCLIVLVLDTASLRTSILDSASSTCGNRRHEHRKKSLALILAGGESSPLFSRNNTR